MPEKNRMVFVHTHIIKCGGTTFFHILKKLFGSGFYRDESLIFYQYTAKQMLEIMHNCPWLKAYSSHKTSLDLPFDAPELDLKAIVFVRDPVDRFLSHYFMHSNRKPNSLKSAPLAQELDLPGYINYALIEKNLESYIDGQVRFLMKRADQDAIDQIRTLTENDHVLLFPLSQFDDACIILEKMFPDYFSDCAYERKNISLRNEEVTADHKKLISDHVGNLDHTLLKMSHDFIDKKLAEFVGNEDNIINARNEFSARCGQLQSATTHVARKKIKYISYIAHKLRSLTNGSSKL
jgi:hypothetical protein